MTDSVSCLCTVCTMPGDPGASSSYWHSSPADPSNFLVHSAPIKAGPQGQHNEDSLSSRRAPFMSAELGLQFFPNTFIAASPGVPCNCLPAGPITQNKPDSAPGRPLQRPLPTNQPTGPWASKASDGSLSIESAVASLSCPFCFQVKPICVQAHPCFNFTV